MNLSPFKKKKSKGGAQTVPELEPTELVHIQGEKVLVPTYEDIDKYGAIVYPVREPYQFVNLHIDSGELTYNVIEPQLTFNERMILKKTAEAYDVLVNVGTVLTSVDDKLQFLDDTFSNTLPQFPLGAGLGRWGMINAYFGDSGNWQSGPIWVEIAWTAWVLDGGIPLTLAWLVALTVTTLFAVRVAVRRTEGQPRPISLWAAIIFGYDIGALALTFNSHPFSGTFGLDFWLLNGALFAAAMNEGSTSSASRHVEPPLS